MKQGGTDGIVDCPSAPVVALEGRPGLESRAGEAVNPEDFRGQPEHSMK